MSTGSVDLAGELRMCQQTTGLSPLQITSDANLPGGQGEREAGGGRRGGWREGEGEGDFLFYLDFVFELHENNWPTKLSSVNHNSDRGLYS